jgi:diguanylate cyclase (GGDEF)-like protein
MPFLVVATVAELSLILSPSTVTFWGAIVSVLLLLLAIGVFLLLEQTSAKWAFVAVPLIYSGSALALILSAGLTSGVGLVILLPVVWAALYLEVWQSIVVVGVVVIDEFVTSIAPISVSDSIRLRRLGIYLLMTSLIVFSVHELRIRIARISSQREALNVEMAQTIGALRERNRCATILRQLVDMLNSCSSRDEAYEVIEHAAHLMFGTGGSVSFLNASKDHLETRCAWDGFASELQFFDPDDCWALRRGQEYESKPGEIPCAHLRERGQTHTICRPMLAQGEIMGVFTITVPEDIRNATDDPSEVIDANSIRQQFQQNVYLFTEQISIWMANFNLREILRHQSIRDPLTNLFNRRFMEETLTREMSSALRTRDKVSIVQIDIDHFKRFNDNYGHAMGDAILIAISGVILNMFRGSDVPCRSGGEEFTLVLPKCSWESARARAEELQSRVAALDAPTLGGETPVHLPTMSIGIATSPEHGASSKSLLRSADLALYAAKSAGRDRIVRASPADDDSTSWPMPL